MPSSSTEEDGKDAAILRELREISNKHSLYTSRSSESTTKSSSKEKENKAKNDTHTAYEDNERADADVNNFLCQTYENPELNQYWYSKYTIGVLCNAIREGLSISGGKRVAFLSTPSIYFSLSPSEREHCALFDFDTSWNTCSGYHFYDYNDPTNVDEICHGQFDLVVIDPPFIAGSVWESYAITANLLTKKGCPLVIATTVDENATLMHDLFGCKQAHFRPSIPHLVYQYSVYANFASQALADKNPELIEGRRESVSGSK